MGQQISFARIVILDRDHSSTDVTENGSPRGDQQIQTEGFIGFKAFVINDREADGNEIGAIIFKHQRNRVWLIIKSGCCCAC